MILIGLALLIWQLYEVVTGSTTVGIEFIVVIIIGIALVLLGAWLAKGGKVGVSA